VYFPFVPLNRIGVFIAQRIITTSCKLRILRQHDNMFKWFAAGAVAGATAANANRGSKEKPADAAPSPAKPLHVPSSSTALVQHQHEGPGSMVPGSNPGPIVDLLKRCLLLPIENQNCADQHFL